MSAVSSLESLIASRIAAASAPTPPDGVSRLARYVELLAHWNRRINLTSLDIAPATDAAIDRLIVEPLLASRWIRPADRRVVDLGSGGGSPAIPLAIAVPSIQMTMVESRGKKCAFLREAARELGLLTASVEQARFEELVARAEWSHCASVVSVRAVSPAVFWHITNYIAIQTCRLLVLSAAVGVVPAGWTIVATDERVGLSVLDRSE